MTKDLINRITYHLSSGGLFNPELADHLAVRNLLMECREVLAQPEQEPVGDFYITKDMAEVDWTICASGSKRPTEKKVVPVFVGNTTPPQRKPLTDEEMFELAEIAWRHGWASCRDAEYVGEEAEDERWGMVGAEVVQDIAAHGIKGEA